MAEFIGNNWFRKHYLVILIPSVFVVYTFLIFLVNPYGKYWDFSERKALNLSIELIGIIIFCSLTTLSCIYLSNVLNKHLPWEKNSFYRGIVQLSVHLIFTLALHYTMRYLIIKTLLEPEIIKLISHTPRLTSELDLWRHILVAIAISVLLNFVTTANYFLESWRSSMVEAAELKLRTAELKEIAMQAELQSLKLQLDPHFMFNNFSTLSELIAEDKSLAQSFIEKLSKVYRYMILNINHNLVSLEKELKFLQSYLYLISIRHGENVVVVINVPSDYMEKKIPPITLQLLIENAIKHNVASTYKPLNIAISVNSEEQLIVVNDLQRMSGSDLYSSKLGLKNIQERYRLVSGGEPAVIETASQFCVVLPLLN